MNTVVEPDAQPSNFVTNPTSEKSNTAPIAKAGADITVTLPTSVATLNGSGSDVNGDAITYSWSKISGGAVTTSSLKSASVSLSALVQGTYVFRLTVTDSEGLSASDDVNLTVQAAASTNTAPIAKAGADITITLPTSSATLNGSGTDANGDAITYSWSKISGGTVTTSSLASASLSLSSLTQGSYVFRLKVTDSKGLSGTDDVTVTVNAASGSNGPLPPTPIAGKVQLWKRDVGLYGMSDYDAVVFLPADYGQVPGKKYPLILSLYGTGGSVMDQNHTAPGGLKEGFIKQVWDGSTLQSTFPAIVIAPDGRRAGDSQSGAVWWNVDFNKRLIDSAIAYYSVDTERIVVTGLSAGGGGTNDLITKYTSMFAGAMPISFFPPDNNNPAFDECIFEKFPIWANGNRDDGTFNYWNWEGAGYDSFSGGLKACSGYADGLIITSNATGGHGGWDAHWQRADVQQWLISQKRGYVNGVLQD